ncbi:MAG: ceramidase domain-containing protein [Planctomycetota bacterium]|nr:ceramidase domain-containing protein [Planctomycetota bacterium]
MKLKLLTLLAVVVAAALFAYGFIAQDPAYHNFADGRGFAGIPNFGDVLSNVPFLVVGVLGLIHTPHDVASRSRQVYWYTFFAGVALVALGSGYYHTDPNDSTLLWDRLPMTIAFMALFTLVIEERVSALAAKRLFPVLITVGFASVLIWRFGSGDLRLYGFVQFFPMLAIPFLVWTSPTNARSTRLLWCALGAYAAAKALEATDVVIFDHLRIASGHTLKHLAAALATWFLYCMMRSQAPDSQLQS